MSRTTINFLLDVFLLATFSLLVTISVVLQFVFPPGSAAAGWTLWQRNYDQWCDLQFTLIAVLTLSILIHVMLHWTWVCGVVAKWLAHRRRSKKLQWDNGTRTIVGVGLLIILLNVMGLVIAGASLSIQGPDRSLHIPLPDTKTPELFLAHRTVGRSFDKVCR